MYNVFSIAIGLLQNKIKSLTCTELKQECLSLALVLLTALLLELSDSYYRIAGNFQKVKILKNNENDFKKIF